MSGVSTEALAAFPGDPRILAAATRQGVWRSEDGGRSWRRISPPDDDELMAATAVAFDPGDASVLYAGTTHLPWKTEDGGATWKSIHQGMIDDSDVFSIFLHPARPQQVFASACSGIYVSVNGARAWRRIQGIPGTHRRTHAIRQDLANERMLYAGTTLGLLRSLDGGASWKQLNALQVRALALDPSEPRRLYLAAENGGIYRSDDRGETLTPLLNGFVNRKVTSLTAGAETIYLNSMQDGAASAVFASRDGGRTWRQTAGAEALGGYHVHTLASLPGDDQTVFAASEQQILKSTDGGQRWTPLFHSPRRTRISALHVERAGARAVVWAGTWDGLFRSDDGGAHWSEVWINKRKGHTVRALMADPAGKRLGLRTPSTLYLTEDGGKFWRPIDLPVDDTRIYGAAIPADPKAPILLATTEGLLAWNLETAWTPAPMGHDKATVTAVLQHPGRPGEILAMQYGQVYRSRDGGRTWASLGALPWFEQPVRGLWIAPGRPQDLFAITADLGVALFRLPETQ
jgi:photosystem II stability/assembly factor-like uncharacterized protein